jgi:hypothetical protein
MRRAASDLARRVASSLQASTSEGGGNGVRRWAAVRGASADALRSDDAKPPVDGGGGGDG